MAEAHTSTASSFLTMTYAGEAPKVLDYSHIQRFLKRERKRLAKPLRFFVAGEYGDITGRAHWHMALFGEDYSSTRRPYDSVLFEDDGLTKSWSHGQVLIGKLEYDSAAYVASYVTKKLAGKSGYVVDPETGEIIRSPEMARMSLKPGLGYDYFRKYYDEIIRTGMIYVSGKRVPIPRYFLDKAPMLHAIELKAQRYQASVERWAKEPEEQTAARRSQLRQVAAAALANKRRKI